jgi:protein phosphatase
MSSLILAALLVVAGVIGLIAIVVGRLPKSPNQVVRRNPPSERPARFVRQLPKVVSDADASGPRRPVVLASGFEDDEWSASFESFSIVAAARSDRGRVRPNNEDAYLSRSQDHLYAVADGMGGEVAGEIASRTALDSVAATMLERSRRDRACSDVRISWRGAQLVDAIVEANRQLTEQVSQNPDLRGMGTTIVALKFAPVTNRAYLAHVGDSRAYLFRNGEIKQLTKDHTYGAMAGARGELASRLAWALGVDPAVNVEIQAVEPEVGDKYLLCSDGLTKMLRDGELLELVTAESDFERCATSLIDAANQRGGFDNVTVVLVGVVPPSALTRGGCGQLSQTRRNTGNPGAL